jgi:hypothetical protein
MLLCILLVGLAAHTTAGTVALWLFDEPAGLYPSSILNDSSGNGHIMALGRGGRIAGGRFGRALEAVDPAPLRIRLAASESEGSVPFGIKPLPALAGRTIAPLHWGNATFAALATTGEKHLRTPGFPNVSHSRLNLGAFDWTIELWHQPSGAAREDGVILEIGSGPRGENENLTRLSVKAAGGFVLTHRSKRLDIPSKALETGQWVHLAFTYTSAERQLRLYAGGKLQPLPAKFPMEALEPGEESYLTIGRDGVFGHPLAGRIDELRISDAILYRADFQPPGSHSLTYSGRLPKLMLKAGPPLLFDGKTPSGPLPLGSRKHLFIDDALFAESTGIRFVPQPPTRKEKVMEDLRGHLTLVEDESGLLRIYYQAKDDSLAVVTSRDGVRWEKPELGWEYAGMRNIVLPMPVGLGNVFLDPNAPPDQRWKYFSGVRRRSMFVFSSRDGWRFQPHETAALPFAAGSQSLVYYDDQKQIYAGHHRSDYGMTEGMHTRRRFLLSETKDLLSSWPYQVMTPEKTAEAARRERLKADKIDPWFVDNGPITPPGLGAELPTVIANDDAMDPPGTDIYSTKVIKYPWAPDTYLAFPAVYFHYDGEESEARQTLGREFRKKGSGVIEVQVAVSRDGVRYKRYPRPAYVPINSNGADEVHMMLATHGMVRRGNEIWQYAGGHSGNGVNYHSAFVRHPNSPLWRFVQRVDGFVAAEADYTEGGFKTRPLVFEGRSLRLNIDTGAVGFAQVGFVDEQGKPIPGYSVDDCVYINGDYLDAPVEWLGKGTDVSSLAGRTVQIVFRMRGTKLFAMQFTAE